MTRTAVFSDIHGNLPALEACVADAEARGCKAFANLGDILSGPLWPSETADYLIPRGWPTIAGNHERYVLTTPAAQLSPSDYIVRRECSDDQIAWLWQLRESMTLGNAWCTHARPGKDDEYLLETVESGEVRPATEEEILKRLNGNSSELILHGHSHLPRDVRLSNGQRIVNPGSVGLPAYFADGPDAHVMETGSTDARYLVLEGEEVELIRVPYDFEAAARQAERNGRKSWARYLREGLAR